MSKTSVTIHIEYYALLREERGLNSETIDTQAKTAAELYEELKSRHGFNLSLDFLKVAINGEFSDWGTTLNDEDSVVFIPPVAGG